MDTSVSLVAKGSNIAEKIKENQEKLGSLENRVKYATKHSINYKKSILKDTFVTAAGAAATIAATKAVVNSTKAQGIIMNGINAAKEIVKGKLGADICGKLVAAKDGVVGFWKALPPAAKVVLGAGAAVTAIASRLIKNKYLIKTGQIMKEQEVSAKLEKQEKQKAKELLG